MVSVMNSIYQVPSIFPDEHEEKKCWSKILVAQRRSGMGMRQFCQHHQISFPRLAYWKYKKRKKRSTSKQKKNPNNRRQDTGAKKFVPLQITRDLSFDEYNREISKDKNVTTEILFKNGHKLIQLSPIKEAYLFSVIKMLSEL